MSVEGGCFPVSSAAERKGAQALPLQQQADGVCHVIWQAQVLQVRTAVGQGTHALARDSRRHCHATHCPLGS